ncbi:MAG: PKD domain-containing protein, partial [Bacteroidia bacterium]|nr:PKD domain-containing protein [Bacteroidia bacterium]
MPAYYQFSAVNVPQGSQITWNFGDGTPPVSGFTVQNTVHVFTQNGSFDVSMSVVLPGGIACPTVVKQDYVVIEEPVVRFGADSTRFCGYPHTVRLTDSTLNATNWLWIIDGVPAGTTREINHTFTSPGCKTVTLQVLTTDTCNAGASLTKPNYICLYDTVDFAVTPNPNSGCLPLNVTFTPNLGLNGNTITNWQWQFPGGNPASFTGQNPPPITYTTEDTFDVILTVTNSLNCTYRDTLRNQVFTGIGANPTFTMNPTTQCAGANNIIITNTTPNLSNLPGSFSWIGGPGVTVTPINATQATVSAASPGQYTVQLQYSNNGCIRTSNTLTFTVTGPQADFSAPPIQLASCTYPDTVTFTSPVVTPAGNSYTWIITNQNGDTLSPTPFTSNSPSYTQIFPDSGLFNVTMIVSNPNGCRDTLTRENYVFIGRPIASFSPLDTVVCAGLAVRLFSTTVPIEFPYQRTWTITGPLGPNQQNYNYTGANPTFTPTMPGYYRVRHIVRNGNACRDTLTKDTVITVNGIDATMVTPNPNVGCAPFTSTPFNINVTQNFHVPNPDPSLTYLWISTPAGGIFSPNNQAANPTVSFSNPGTYTITCRLVNSTGCIKGLVSQPFNIGIRATMQAPDKACVNTPVQLQGGSTINPAGSYQWSVNPPVPFFPSATVSNPTITFPSDGSYTVTLIVRGIPPVNCSDTIVKVIQVQSVTGDFSTLVFGDTVASCATGGSPKTFALQAFSPTAVNYIWNFGDGSPNFTTQDSLASHTYNQNGYFDVSLIVIDDIGCRDTIVKPNYLYISGPIAHFTADVVRGCEPLVVNFRDSSRFAEKVFIFYGDGSPYDSFPNPMGNRTKIFRFPQNTPLIQDSIVYLVSILAIDNNCRD